MYEQLIADLREEAEWAEGNEWETPIMLSDHLKQATDAITALQKKLENCRNELCLRCGQYKERHNGACDGCRWNA